MSNETQPEQPHIGTLNEGSLHADLKQHYLEPGDVSDCLLYTSPSPRDTERSRMPSSA